MNGTTLRDALTSLIAAKQGSNRRPRYVRGLELYVRQFIDGRETEPVGSVTTEDVETWLRERKESPSVMRGDLGRLSCFFSFSVRRGWIAQNPVARVERPRVEVPEPFILTVDQCRKLVEAVRADRPDLLVPLVLTLFCGLRSAESQAVGSTEIREGFVMLTAAQSKKRRRRQVPISPNAAALMAGWTSDATLCGRNGWLALNKIGRRTLALRKWPQDALRHTAASMMLAREQDAERVSLWLGDSPGVLLRHYVSPVQVPDCAAFWSIGM